AEVTTLDLLREADLLRGGKQIDLGDVLQGKAATNRSRPRAASAPPRRRTRLARRLLACTAYHQSRPRKRERPEDNLPAAERHRIERRVNGGVRLAKGRSRRDHLHLMLFAPVRKARELWASLPRRAAGLCPNGPVRLALRDDF